VESSGQHSVLSGREYARAPDTWKSLIYTTEKVHSLSLSSLHPLDPRRAKIISVNSSAAFTNFFHRQRPRRCHRAVRFRYLPKPKNKKTVSSLAINFRLHLKKVPKGTLEYSNTLPVDVRRSSLQTYLNLQLADRLIAPLVVLLKHIRLRKQHQVCGGLYLHPSHYGATVSLLSILRTPGKAATISETRRLSASENTRPETTTNPDGSTDTRIESA
jgi:hypothetical protein